MHYFPPDPGSYLFPTFQCFFATFFFSRSTEATFAKPTPAPAEEIRLQFGASGAAFGVPGTTTTALLADAVNPGATAQAAATGHEQRRQTPSPNKRHRSKTPR